MEYYITYGELQYHLREYYERMHQKSQFLEIINYLKNKGMLSSERPADIHSIAPLNGAMTDAEINKIIDDTVINVTQDLDVKTYVIENELVPKRWDVFVIRHPLYTRPFIHMHDYFELNYVSCGSCKVYFEQEEKTMSEGELCIIAPGSRHDIEVDEGSTVFTIIIRKSTFDTTFFSLLSQNNLLAHFFRTILHDSKHPNYLLFHAKDSIAVRTYILNAFSECIKADTYSNLSCINWINLLFTELLRSYGHTIQFYNYQMGPDFSLILQYIQHNFRTLTLASLAEFFHYTEPHLCTLVKQNTGYTFTELIKQLRMTNAISLLTNTNLKIGEIAEQVGYNSADHFSRVFRQTYNMSPKEYKDNFEKDNDVLIPFSKV